MSVSVSLRCLLGSTSPPWLGSESAQPLRAAPGLDLQVRPASWAGLLSPGRGVLYLCALRQKWEGVWCQLSPDLPI